MDDRTTQEKLIVAIIAVIGLLITLAAYIAKLKIQNQTVGSALEIAGFFVGGVAFGGLPVGWLLDWLRRRKQQRTGEEIRRMFQELVRAPSTPKDDLPKLIALDIEGCITPSGRSAVELVRLQRLRAYCDLAIRDPRYPPVVFYTGRSQGYVELLAQELGIINDRRDLPCVIESGTALYYPYSKRTVLLGDPADLQANRALLHAVSELLRNKFSSHEFEPKCYMVTINPALNQTVENLLTAVDSTLRAENYETNRADPSAPRDKSKKGYFRVTSSASAVDITPESLTKLSGLLEVARQAGAKQISQNGLEKTLAVGDHSNDVEVLRTVGIPYCPEDAHGEVRTTVSRNHPDNVIPAKDVDFVIVVIERECGLRIVNPLDPATR